MRRATNFRAVATMVARDRKLKVRHSLAGDCVEKRPCKSSPSEKREPFVAVDALGELVDPFKLAGARKSPGHEVGPQRLKRARGSHVKVKVGNRPGGCEVGVEQVQAKGRTCSGSYCGEQDASWESEADVSPAQELYPGLGWVCVQPEGGAVLV